MIISRPWLLVLGIVGLICEYFYNTPMSMQISMFALYIFSYMFEYLETHND